MCIRDSRQGFCKICANSKRRKKYETDANHRQKCIDSAIAYKQKKKAIKDKENVAHQQSIGLDNMECKYCFQIKHIRKFRWNRKKCRDCERDDPKEKFKRYVRTRIYNCLKVHKSKSHIEYLGTSTNDYLDWIINYDSNYNLDNYGSTWHIDHVIPISHFDLTNKEDQLIAFNWRNTMPLDAKTNLIKNNRINTMQITQHYDKLLQYNQTKNLKMPEKFIDLYATYLDAGTS